MCGFLICASVMIVGPRANAEEDRVEEKASSVRDDAPQDDASLDSDAKQNLFDFLAAESVVQVTTATKTSKSIEDTPAIVAVIGREEIARLGVRSLWEVLRLVPGINIVRNQDGSRRVDVRGRSNFASNGVKILIDGHSMNEPFNGSATFLHLERPLDDIEQIEIIRGPGSALYGANAFVAVINLITESSDEARVTLYGDSHLGYHIAGRAGGMLGPVNFGLHAAYGASDVDSPVIEADSLFGTSRANRSLAPGPADTSRERLDLDLKLSWKWLELTARYSDDRRGDFAGTDYLLSVDPGSESRASVHRGYQLLTELKIDVPIIEDKLSLGVRGYFDLIGLREELKLTPSGFNLSEDLDGDGDFEIFEDGKRRTRRWDEWIAGTELQLTWEIFKGNTLVAGYVYEVQRLQSAREFANFDPLSGAAFDTSELQRVGDFTEPNYSREIIALYAQDVWRIVKPLSLTLGLRADRYNDFGYAFSPRAALVYTPIEGLSFKGLYGRAFRAPSLDELFARGESGTIGNPTLKAEKLDTGEVAVLFQRSELGPVDSLNIKLDGYFTSIQDAIGESESPALTGPTRLRNVASIWFAGIELELDMRMFKRVEFGGNLTYQKAIDRGNANSQIAGVPEWLGNVHVNVRPWRMSFVSLGLSIVGPRAREAGDNQNPTDPSRALFDGRNNPISTGLDMWFALGLSKFKAGPLDLRASLRAENLLGLAGVDPTPVYRDFGDATFPGDLPRRARTFMLTLSAAYSLEKLAKNKGVRPEEETAPGAI